MIAFVVGCPGVGKSALVRALVGPSTPWGRWTLGATCAALGPYTGATFDGLDALPLSRALVESAFTKAQASLSVPLLVDGVRSQRWMLEWWRARTAQVIALHLVAPLSTLQARRARRGSSPCPPTWYETEIAKARSLADHASRVVTIDTDRTPPRAVLTTARTLLR